eukprot:TRINITY_DN21272_c0_g1_i5.p1 TRINITY_DN21272_c0_g1~~TRINITY_DN21272_c0_g1_i5.p1  ORF type:complete len:560 (+),score=113.19 TRINITY_DN21272_c0_g1_i5:172-1851(+)
MSEGGSDNFRPSRRQGRLSSGMSMNSTETRFSTRVCLRTEELAKVLDGDYSSVSPAREDEEDSRDATIRPTLRRLAQKLVRSTAFEKGIGTVIIVNAFSIGYEQTLRLQGKDMTPFQVVENLFLVIFIMELVLRFLANGMRQALKENWIKLDVVIVISGMITSWIMVPFKDTIEVSFDISVISVLKLARVLRLARMVRQAIKIKSLWILLQGMISSSASVIYTMMTLVFVTYIFGCMAIDLVTTNSLAVGPDADPAFQEVVEENFASLPMTMLTLVRFVTFDNVSLIYTPLIMRDPLLCPFFMVALTALGIVLMNLLTAVVVNNAVERASEDREARMEWDKSQKARMAMEVQKLFRELDVDDSGFVSRQELQAIGSDDLDKLEYYTKLKDPIQIFEYLNIENSEELDMDVFCKGIEAKVFGNDVGLQIQRLDRRILKLEAEVRNVDQLIDGIADRVAARLEKVLFPDVHVGYPGVGIISGAERLQSSMQHRQHSTHLPCSRGGPLASTRVCWRSRRVRVWLCRTISTTRVSETLRPHRAPLPARHRRLHHLVDLPGEAV